MTGLPSPALDKHIRRALAAFIREQHSPVTVIDELPLLRDGRADVAAVNGSLCGYEIKSASDSLARLPRQIPLYEAVFDYCYVVVARRHLHRARTAIPLRWGIFVADECESGVIIRRKRQAKYNGNTSQEALIRLMWKDEIARTLNQNGVRASASQAAWYLWEQMLQLPKDVVRAAARDAISARAFAGFDPSPRIQCGG
jgi:hypothetical protein